jgi:Leucine-rich repeat (LRR) protein
MVHLHFHRTHRVETFPTYNPRELDTWCQAVPNEQRNRRKAATRINECIKELQHTPASKRTFISLDLAGLKLSDINWGEDVYQQLNVLPNLFLQNNRLTTLPEEIGLCKKLSQLICDNNPLQSLPEAIIDCRSLQTLNIANANLSELPTEIFELPHLHTLHIEKNKITHIDDDFLFGSNMIELNLDHNLLTTLPKFIQKMGKDIVSAEHNPIDAESLFSGEQ